MRAILATCRTLFDRLTPPAMRPPAWHVEIHQFRIEARPALAGKPTPEGMHRDGVDWVLVLLVSRVNIASGETTIADLGEAPLGSFTLTDPLDSAVTDDNRVFHGVTPVTPLDPARPGHATCWSSPSGANRRSGRRTFLVQIPAAGNFPRPTRRCPELVIYYKSLRGISRKPEQGSRSRRAGRKPA